MDRSRSGVILAMILGLLLVLGAFGFALHTLSRAAYRETDVVATHLRAVAVGEAGFAEIVARLSAKPWVDRWFRAGPDAQPDQAAAGGAYAFVISDTPVSAQAPDAGFSSGTGTPNMADLLVRATYEKSTVIMFWRLIVPEDSVESLARVVPVIFVFGPDGTPLSPAGASVLSQQVDVLIRDRIANRAVTDPLTRPLSQTTSLAGLQSALGDPAPGGLDALTDPGGANPRDLPPYVTSVNSGEGERPPLGSVPPSGYTSPTVTPPAPPATGSNRIFICHVRDLIRYLPWMAAQVQATNPAMAAQMTAAADAIRAAFYNPPGYYDPGGPGVANAAQVQAYYTGLALFNAYPFPPTPKFPTWSSNGSLAPWPGP